ncbi:rop guanine nucleotide exchange factor 14 [Argentina anserina]|uniref:rop guanine nucleotide exchange factor 14 n=1 Tax=Argentina anserina TaxID=57926 RepID=UPI002176216A|nr:rop guanine nucleotide exchange factor 14 [Potentilla anserina]
MKRGLACCTRDREISVDFDEHERIMTYNGLENCILNVRSFENESRTSRGDEFATDSMDDDASTCSSGKDAFGSFSSKWLTVNKDDHGLDQWDHLDSPKKIYVKEKPSYALQYANVEAMKEKFAKLLLGDDITGGHKGLSTALALSNAITNLAATVFGELWKLEPLSEERKTKWRREMDWFLSPTNYMVELVPARQNGANGRTLEIMTPKARADIHINLPALKKLDSMLILTLDSMVDTEFGYVEVGSRAEGRNRTPGQSKRWWLPSPQVPATGLSDKAKNNLLKQGRVVHQVFKAARTINESVLLEMPVPTIIRDALPKSGKASLGEELYKILTAESSSAEEVLNSLNLKSEHYALDVINRLEAAVFSWKERITEQESGKSPVRASWSFIKDPMSEINKMESLLDRAERLLQQLKNRYHNLPQTFLDATKIQYGKDIGHSILEAYSRVLGNLAFSILSRIGDILHEDALNTPNSLTAPSYFPGISFTNNLESSVLGQNIRNSSFDRSSGDHRNSGSTSCSVDLEFSYSVTKGSPLTATPSRARAWCIGREACISVSPTNSP